MIEKLKEMGFVAYGATYPPLYYRIKTDDFTVALTASLNNDEVIDITPSVDCNSRLNFKTMQCNDVKLSDLDDYYNNIINQLLNIKEVHKELLNIKK